MLLLALSLSSALFWGFAPASSGAALRQRCRLRLPQLASASRGLSSGRASMLLLALFSSFAPASSLPASSGSILSSHLGTGKCSSRTTLPSVVNCVSSLAILSLPLQLTSPSSLFLLLPWIETTMLVATNQDWYMLAMSCDSIAGVRCNAGSFNFWQARLLQHLVAMVWRAAPVGRSKNMIPPSHLCKPARLNGDD